MIQTLNFPSDSYITNTFRFRVNVGHTLHKTGYLSAGETHILIMQLFSDVIHKKNRLNSSITVKHGDIVQVESKQYKVVILGDYIDAGYLLPAE